MNSNIFAIGSLEIKWYSILLLLSFFIGIIFVYQKRKIIKLNDSNLFDMLFYLIIFAVLGARIYYVLFNFDYYLNNPLDIIKIWEGGLAIHGGVIAGFVYLFFYCKRKKIKLILLTDIIVFPLSLGQAIGRWGNFFNQEAYGPITTYHHLKELHIPNFIIDGMHINGVYYQPTFLYESIFCLLIFIVLLIVSKLKNNKNGVCTAIYLILYGFERFFMEILRQDSLMILNIKVAQLVSVLMIILGIVILFIVSDKVKKKQLN